MKFLLVVLDVASSILDISSIAMILSSMRRSYEYIKCDLIAISIKVHNVNIGH